MTLLTLIIGAFFGSFCSKMVYRLAANRFKGISILSPSFCPVCGKQIKLRDKIPIYSYIHLRGKCSRCHESISIRYFIFELIGALLPFFLYWYLNYSFYPVLFSYLFLMAMLVDFYICLDTIYPSDRVSLFILVLAIIKAYLSKTTLSSGLFSMALGAMLILMIQIVFDLESYRPYFLLFGASLGLFFLNKAVATLYVLFILLLLFNLIHNALERKKRIYFGSMLCFAGALNWLLQEQLIDFFENLIVFLMN